MTLQAWQVPQLMLPQQTLSTQAPWRHSVPVMHPAPSALRLQFPLWQVSGATQSVSVLQLVPHALPAQTNGAQPIGFAVAHDPEPLQLDAGVKVDPLHICAPHETLVSACWHLPAPSQFPVLPHGAVVEVPHWPAGAAPPDGMLEHTPALPETLQAWQVPHDLDAQQTPSTQVSPVKQLLVAQL